MVKVASGSTAPTSPAVLAGVMRSTMLNAGASGVPVVDVGYGAGHLAAQIAAPH